VFVDTGLPLPYIQTTMATRDSIGGFDVLARRELGEYRARAVHLRHGQTGCEVLHLETADTENLFSFCFATPPRDDTGVSHIAEHSVLSGSRRFPLKEPFSALMKGSLHTFLNALTYPDRTVYPASSCNRRDFYNLMLVYGDAVFHPLLRDETFMQEAWRLETEGESLKYAGVVFNEMKGAHASPDSIVAEWALRSLFPDTPYRHDSGGDPRAIPELTREALRQFHARHYHPSNCKIFLYGNIPLAEILAFIEESFLTGFGRARVDAAIPLQPRWNAHRRREESFPVKPGTSLGGRATVTVSWLLPPVTDPLALVTHEVLSEALIGSAGSPLRKALVDSGLGEDLSPASGLETDLREMVFAAGLRGTDPDREERICALIDGTLSSLSSGGLDPALVESVINRVEFRHREIRGGGGPYALRLMGRVFRGWVHGADPISSLEFSPSIEALKGCIAADPRYLEKCIGESLLSNLHRVTLVVRPDPDHERRSSEEDARRLEAVARRLSAAEREGLVREAEAFRAYQLAPDLPEALATIPSLTRADLPPEIEKIPSREHLTPSGVSLSLHDIFTNDVVYIDLGFPTDCIEGARSLLLPLFGRAVCGCGLPGLGYDRVALDLVRLTGGFAAALDAGGIVGAPEAIGQFAFFRLRCLRHNLRRAAAIVGRLLSSADFRDLGRLRDLVLELRNDMKSALIPSGHQFAMLRAAGMISASVAKEEEWRGVTQLAFLDDLASGLDSRREDLAAQLEGIRRDLLVRSRVIVNATAGGECFTEIGEAADSIVSILPAQPEKSAAAEPARSAAAAGKAESLVASAPVGYVARAIPGYRYEDAASGAAAVLGHILSTGSLWEKVRMEGGAYGAFSYPRNTDGLFLFGSYRDPHIVRTLRAFRESLEEVARNGQEEAEVEKAVIGTVGREDRPLDPGERGFVSLQRKLHGLTDAARQARRDRLVSADGEALAEAARGLLETFEKGATAVIAGRQALRDAAAELPELGVTVTELPE